MSTSPSRNRYTLHKLKEASRLPPHEGPLARANIGFHKTYTRFVEQILTELGQRLPVLVLLGNDLTLLCDGEATRREVIPASYHELKAVAHLAFGVQLALIANCNRKLAITTARDLHAKRSEILEAQTAAEVLMKQTASPRPVKLLRQALVLIDRVLAERLVDLKELRDEIQELARLGIEAGRLAVCTELERLHSAVKAWREQLGEARWHDSYVVICGNHQPGYREAASQYFARLLHRPAGFAAEREERWLFGEGLASIDAALDLLARHIVDQRVSRVLFGDRCHLQRDLFAEAAAAELRQILPPAHRG